MSSYRVKDQVSELNEKLEKLDRRYAKESKRIGENPDWSQQKKQRETLELWAEHKQSWQRAVKEKRELLDKALRQAQKSAFGPKEKDPSAMMSFRDAYSRIGEIDDKRHLQEVLERAIMVGDTDMQRALTLRAYELQMPDLLEASFAGRDSDYRRYDELVEVSEIYNSEIADWSMLEEEPIGEPSESHRYSEPSELQANLQRAAAAHPVSG